MNRGHEDTLAVQAYALINAKADSNAVLQGLTSIAGFPLTIIADGAVILTHYKPMLDEIRQLYGRYPVNESVIMPILNSISSEILFDLLADKLLGNIPLIGIYFNAICAKTMTWRLGILFAMLSARGEGIEEAEAIVLMQKIRCVFPQNDTFRFKQPDYDTFLELVQV